MRELADEPTTEHTPTQTTTSVQFRRSARVGPAGQIEADLVRAYNILDPAVRKRLRELAVSVAKNG
jgi:hypothetical protein